MIWITKTLDFFKKIDTRTLAFIGGALLVLFMMRQCNTISNLKEDVKKQETIANDNFNNYLAAKDSIVYFENQLGESVAQVASYKFRVGDLEKANLNLNVRYIKALNLNKDLKDVNALLSAELKIKDSLLAASSVTSIDSLTGLVKFYRNDNFDSINTRKLDGSLIVRYNPTTKSFTSMPANISILQTLGLVAAIENIEGRDRLKITSSYPGLTITRVENINLVDDRLNKENKIDKKAGFSVGMGVGYGINLNPTNSTVNFGPSINVGLYWSPAWLRF
jgi:hypothetical protein